MAQEDVIAEFGENSKGKPCVTVSLRDLRGTGFWPRDYVDLDIHQARELLDELKDAVDKLDEATPEDE